MKIDVPFRTRDEIEKSLTAACLTDIAMRDTMVVTVASKDHPCFPVDDLLVHGWSFKWKATHGREDRGMLVLRPKSELTRFIAVSSRVNAVAKVCKCGEEKAFYIQHVLNGQRLVHNVQAMKLLHDHMNHEFWNGLTQYTPGVLLKRLMARHGHKVRPLRRMTTGKLIRLIRARRRLLADKQDLDHYYKTWCDQKITYVKHIQRIERN